jgi:hypothetical protein
MKKTGLFRYKVMEWHREANEERRHYHENSISLKEYITRYRWWLRDKFRKEQDADRNN